NTHNFNYPIICALKPDKNELWLGLRSQGLFWFSNNNYTTPTNRLLKNTTVTSISKDKEGNFWLTTLEDGIYLLRTLNVISYRALDEEDNNKYLATFSDRENLWIGTDKGFTYKVNQKNAFFRYSSLESAVTSIIQTDRKEIWLGSNSGLHKVNGNHLTLIPSETNLARIFNGQDGKIWASRNKSLHIFKDDKWQKCEGKNEGENGYIDALIEDKNGIAWLACNDGLWQYDISKAIYTKIKSVNVRINDLKIAKNQSIWMASQGEGIFLIENGRQKKFKKENGLLSNLCNNVYIDDNETVWVSTYKGLNFIKRAQNGNFTIGAITTKDGLISNEVLECCKFQNKLWVFTGNGISVFDPDKIKPDTFSPPTYITAVNINARSTPLSKSYTLDYQENNIAIEFLALYFKNAGKVRYRYKMLGIDTSWNYTENTSVQYGTLQPGKYTFMVAAQNNSGSWAAVSDNILFNIHPPYWQKTWFRILIFLLFLSLIALLVNFRIRYVVKRKNLIYELEGYKNHALQARMNPHFIFNSLNSINNYILQNDKLNSSKYLSKFASLMRFILDNSVRTDISLETELRGLQLYLELEKQRFKEKLNYTISISPDINVNTTKIPALILQPFVENAILHGILTKNTPGNIQIIIKRENEKISCIIQDDGIGRKKSSERVERKSHDHVSNGIAVTKQRLDIINKLHQEKTVLEISDILNENGEIAGTKVQLSWPIY
ncbi:MAG: histidine kinase, partial [Bacteroidia bacterium]